MCSVCTAGPDFGTCDFPATFSLDCRRSNRRQVRPRVWLTHSDCKKTFPCCNFGQDQLASTFAAMAQNLIATLSISHPMCSYRCTTRQHFFRHDIPIECCSFLTAVFFRPNHADVAGLPALATELCIAIGPRVFARGEGACIFLFLEEVTNLLPEQTGTLWQGHCRKYKIMHVILSPLDWIRSIFILPSTNVKEAIDKQVTPVGFH